MESRESMPAHAWEVQAAEEEGVSVFPGRSFERILGDENGRASGVECLEVSSFSFDESGRLNVEKIAGSNHVIPCDTVIFSVGQRAGLAFIPDDAGVGLTSQKTIAINPFLTGEGLEPAPKPELPVVRLSRAEIESRMARGEIHRSPRIPLPELPVNQRIDSFAEI